MIINGVKVYCKLKEDYKSYEVELSECTINFKEDEPYVFIVSDDTCYCNGATILKSTFNEHFDVIKIL